MSDTPIFRQVTENPINRITTNLVPIGASISASYAVSASWSPSAQAGIADFNTLTNKPTLVSSSAQIPSVATSSLATTASFAIRATSASYAPTILPVGVISSSVQINDFLDADNVFSSSAQVDYTAIQNKPTTIATASFVQLAVSASYAPLVLPVGVVSSSTQIASVATASYVLNSVSSSYAVTASYALNGGSGGAGNYLTLTNVPVGIVSSSTQAKVFDDARGVVSSSAQAVTWTVATASYVLNAVSASWAPGVGGTADFNILINKPALVSASSQIDYAGIQNKPTTIATASFVQLAVSASYAPTILPAGTVSSSAQINTGSFTGSFTGAYTGSVLGSSSFATTASAATSLTFIPLSSSYAPLILPVGVVSSSAQVSTWSVATASFVLNAVSASYAPLILPAGTVSSSVQINTGSFTGSFSGQHTGSLLGTASVAVSASYALTASYALNGGTGNYLTLTNVPVGIVSSSTQAGTWTVATASYVLNAVSASWAPGVGGTADFNVLINKPALVSASSQIDYTGLQNKPTTIPTASYVLNAISASYAPFTLPLGTVSSSVQINTGSFTGSFSGQHTGSLLGSASFATTASAATSITFIPVSSSYAPLVLPVGVVSSSAQASTWTVATASFVQNAVSASYAPFSLPNGSVSSSAQINTGSFTGSFVGAYTGSLLGTASVAVSSSYALTASYALAGGSTAYSALTGVPLGILSSSIQFNALTNTSASYAQTATSSSYASGTINFPSGLSLTAPISASGFSGSGDSLTMTYQSASLSADVTMTNANQWYSSSQASITLPVGVWNVFANITMTRTGAVSSSYNARLSDGTNSYYSGQQYVPANNPASAYFYLGGVIKLGTAATIGIHALASSGSAVMKAATNTNGVGNNATVITAIKIG